LVHVWKKRKREQKRTRMVLCEDDKGLIIWIFKIDCLEEVHGSKWDELVVMWRVS
jgi:hypothetical protein